MTTDPIGSAAPPARLPRRWPLVLIAAPAAVSIWSGWVGLGELCGFGVVHPLPGIIGSFRLNTAITLPVGVEAYGAYALGAWMHPGVPASARTFARRSAIGALLLGMTGQVIFHLLAAAHTARAPWPVVVLVSVIPVITLGFGAALTHLLTGAPGLEQNPPEQSEILERQVSAPRFTDTQSAALTALIRTTEAGNPLSRNTLETRFRLTRAEATKVVETAAALTADHGEPPPQLPSPNGEVTR